MSNGGNGRRRSSDTPQSLMKKQSMMSIAEESIARDLEREENAQVDIGHVLSRTTSRGSQLRGGHSMGTAHRRPSNSAATPAGGVAFMGVQHSEPLVSSARDWEDAIEEERTLLRDNAIIDKDSEHDHLPQTSSDGFWKRLLGRRKSRTRVSDNDLESAATARATETTPLLDGETPQADNSLNDNTAGSIDRKFHTAVLNGDIHTTWQREARTIGGYAAPLVLTYFLQNTLTLTSIFTVGHIGKIEMGATSLGAMTASITGYAIYHGLATSLDTLCAQAYGSGKKHLVGLQLQRMVFFLWAITIPIACVWLAGTQILRAIVPEKEIADLAGKYLKVLIFGAPGYACFESSKRYVQAQGIFSATLYVLLIAAPLNIFLHWFFVWHFGWGFIGCPIAISIVETAMPILLFLYVRFAPRKSSGEHPMDCWPGFTWRAFQNWGPMVRLALPGLVMVAAEFLAFEGLTLAAARFSATHLAAQSVLQSLCIVMYMAPFALSIGGSTRVANLIGAGLPDAAKVTARVIITIGVFVGLCNGLILSTLRNYIPRLFTDQMDVVELAAQTLPVAAAFQLFDALAAQCNGLLRGLGRQSIGGLASFCAFYVIALPVSFGTAFGLDWQLLGLWTGPAVGLFVQSSMEGLFIKFMSWQRASEEAAKRNAAG